VPTQTLPVVLVGTGYAPQGLPLFAGGVASHTATGWSNLTGNYSGDGLFTLLNFTGTNTAAFQGTFDFVGSNGDQLVCNYGTGPLGAATLYPVGDHKVIAQFLAVFTPVPSQCTGSFASIIGGSFTMVANSEPFDPTPNAQGYTQPFTYRWHGEGLFVEQAGAASPHIIPALPAAAPQSPFGPVPRSAPFEVYGKGAGPQGLPLFPGGMAPHDSAGVISLLGDFTGKYSGNGMFTNLGFTSPVTGLFQGMFDFVAHNGDQLPCNYGTATPGTFSIYPADNGLVIVQFIAIFTPITSQTTGRFSNILDGSFTMIATSDPFDPTPNAQGYTGPLTYSWVGAGLFLVSRDQSSVDGSQADGSNVRVGQQADSHGGLSREDNLARSWQALGVMLASANPMLQAAATPSAPTIPGVANSAPFASNSVAVQSWPASPLAYSGRANSQDVDALFRALYGDAFVLAL
jgi:hypothetical protein